MCVPVLRSTSAGGERRQGLGRARGVVWPWRSCGAAPGCGRREQLHKAWRTHKVEQEHRLRALRPCTAVSGAVQLVDTGRLIAGSRHEGVRVRPCMCTQLEVHSAGAHETEGPPVRGSPAAHLQAQLRGRAGRENPVGDKAGAARVRALPEVQRCGQGCVYAVCRHGVWQGEHKGKGRGAPPPGCSTWAGVVVQHQRAGHLWQLSIWCRHVASMRPPDSLPRPPPRGNE